MKKNLTKIFTTLIVAGLLAVGVSYVTAWSPSTAIPTPITTSTENQTKAGALLSEKYMASDLGFFTKMLLPGNDSWMNIGGPFTGSAGSNLGIANAGGTIPLTLELSDRSVTTRKQVQGQDSMQFISGGAQCFNKTSLIHSQGSAFAFRSTSNSDGNADIIARQLQLSGGSPQNNSVLAAVDNQGNAVWAHLVIQNGAVTVVNNQTDSPVTLDESCSVQNSYHWVTTWSGCKYLDDSVAPAVYKENPTSNTCKDQNGTTVANSLCLQPAPGPRTAASSLPLCSDGQEGGSNNVLTPWYCHTAGTPQWVTAASRGSSITCTGPYIPQLNTGEHFTEGDIVCTQNKPSTTLCAGDGTPKSTCRPGDSTCPN